SRRDATGHVPADQNPGTGDSPVPSDRINFELFFLFAAFGRFGCSRLRLRFFHRLLGFSGTLGTGLGTLLAFFFLQFLAAQQFDERLLSAVALLPSCTDNPQEASLAVAQTTANASQPIIHGFAAHA